MLMTLASLRSRWRAWWTRMPVRVAAERAPAQAAKRPAPSACEEADILAGVSRPANPAGEAPAVAVLPPIDPALRQRTLEALRDLQQIPALQSLAQGFLRAATGDGGSVEAVVAAVQKDPALCVRVLRLANSALVRPERKIEDVFTAVQMLGLRRVATLTQAMFTLRDAQHVATGLDWRHLWVHALATAALAEELQQRLQVRPEPGLHLAALLHDVGKIVLSTVEPEKYRAVLDAGWNHGAGLDALERSHFGVGHREAGALFARQAGLPAEVIAAIEHHADPVAASGHRVLVALVSLANYLAKRHGLGFSGARLGEVDGELAQQPGWRVLADEAGVRPDFWLLEEELPELVEAVKGDLQLLHVAAAR